MEQLELNLKDDASDDPRHREVTPPKMAPRPDQKAEESNVASAGPINRVQEHFSKIEGHQHCNAANCDHSNPESCRENLRYEREARRANRRMR